MISFEELEMFVEIGKNYRVICEDLCIEGKIIKLGNQSIVLEKENGTKQMISNSSIVSIDEDLSASTKSYSKRIEDFVECNNEDGGRFFDDSARQLASSKDKIKLSAFQRFFLESIDIDKCNTKYFQGKLSVSESLYKGNSHDAKNDIEKLEMILQHHEEEERCEIKLLMARIAYDSVDNSSGEFMTEDHIHSLLGRYFVSKADFYLSESKSDEAAQCYYVEALKLLSENDDGYINKALNMLSYSFFIDTGDIKSEMVSKEILDKKNVGKYFCNAKQVQNVVRDFLLTLFLLKEEKDIYYNMFLDEINKYPEFVSYIKGECAEILSKNDSEIEEEELEDLLKDTYDYCKEILQQLGDLLNNTTKELDLSDKLKSRIQDIEKVRGKKLLLAMDDDYLNAYVKKLRDLVEAIEETNVDEVVDKYCKIVEGTEDNIVDLKSAPTLRGFILFRSVNSSVHDYIKSKVNLLLKNNRPRITNITLTEKSNCFYMKDRTISVEIGIENELGNLTADGIEISVSTEEELKTKIDKRINSIEGGELASQIIKFKLTDDVIKRGKLKFKVVCVYKFRLDFENNSTSDRIEQDFQIDINNEKSFIEIENMYDKVLNGSGCAACPEMFKGRTKLINRLCNSMQLGNGMMNKNRGIVLWGQRRVGKNSVKDSFKKELESRYPGAYIHIDIGSTGVCEESFQSFLERLARCTERTLHGLAKNARKEIDSKEVDVDSERGRQLSEYIRIYDAYKLAGLEKTYRTIHTSDSCVLDFNDYLRDVIDIITDICGNNRNILLFYIDEFTYFYQWIKEGKVNGRIFMQFIKSFISDNGICAVLLAQDNMPVWKDEYSNEFNCMDFDNMITYLDYDGTKELVCEPCPIDGESRFSDDAVHYIYDITRGSAYLIDILCGRIIDYLNENHIERVSKNIVETVLKSWIDGEKTFFDLTTFESQYEDTSKVEPEATRIKESNLELLKELAVKSKGGANIDIDSIEYLQRNNVSYARYVFDLLCDRKIIENFGQFCKIAMPLFTFALLKEYDQMEEKYLNYFTD